MSHENTAFGGSAGQNLNVTKASQTGDCRGGEVYSRLATENCFQNVFAEIGVGLEFDLHERVDGMFCRASSSFL